MTAEVCPYCRTQIGGDDAPTVCEGCGTRHHADCYAENGGCTIFGCSKAPGDEPKLSVSAPELVAVPAAATTTDPVRPLPPPPPPRPGTSTSSTSVQPYPPIQVEKAETQVLQSILEVSEQTRPRRRRRSSRLPICRRAAPHLLFLARCLEPSARTAFTPVIGPGE